MMKKISVFIGLFVFILFMGACVDASGVQPRNPNGDSELALFMREMHDESVKLKENLSKGKKLKPKLDYSKLLTAEATEPEKAASESYKAFALSYISIMDQMKKKSGIHSEENFKAMVASCENCHNSFCPGPLVLIDKLKL
ncbi:MAG: hypothetical protein KJO29_10245 [Bacteroidia bacterium]|nr:hypothetical protein [Bacteroidia bacterium]